MMRGPSKATRPGQFCVISGFAGGACTRSNAASSNENRPPNAASAISRASGAMPGIAAILACEPSAIVRESGTPGAPIHGRAKLATDSNAAPRALPPTANGRRPQTPPARTDPAIGRSARWHDEAFWGHHHPAAVLLADRIHATEPRHDVALIDLDDAHAAFDEGSPAINIAHHPSFDRHRLGRLVQPARGRHDRAGHILGCGLAARKTLEGVEGLGELGRRLGLTALDAVDALADPAELGARVAVGGIDAEFQRRQLNPRLHHV